MSTVISIGMFVRDLILQVAGMLTQEWVPGLVALVLVLILIWAAGAFWSRTGRQLRAIRWLTLLIKGKTTSRDFSADIEQLSDTIKAGVGRSGSRRHLATAWAEYRETFVAHEEDGVVVLRNAVRPSVFMNPEDLDFGPGMWRIAPSLFVTGGLFLTFLGLISALHTMSASEINSHTMATLLQIASAKFIMSLTGLFCSIVFTLVFRSFYGRVDKGLHDLCRAIEDKLTYISLEELAAEQLRATREQREHFRLIGMELVAEIGRPLREELPAAISNSISKAMDPLMDRVGRMGAEGVGDLVSGLSTQLTDKVGIALSEAAQRISDAGSQIGRLAERMDISSGRMGSEMETVAARVAQAVDDLRASMSATAESTGGAFTEGAERLLAVMNQTLEGIRDNTGESARAMSAAAEDMRRSAAAFRQEIEAAAKDGTEAAHARMQAATDQASGIIGTVGQGVADAFARTSSDIARVAAELSEKAAREVISPMERIAQQLGDMVTKLQQGSSDLRRMSDGVRAGADASSDAAANFKSASGDLMAAAMPIRTISERMETSLRHLAETTRDTATTVSEAAETTAQSAANALESARMILGSEARSIEAALAGISNVVERMKGQGDRLDDMDEKLGRAFETYADQVAKAVEGMFAHVRDIQERLSPALDTMSSIVAQMEEFSPQSRRA
ncbi:gas vesicle protein [Rhizobium sp. SG570]|nr:MotA/TolQ/ExbB proton channel family protein [Rhizobium sp. SG570]NKJ36844.1 gas vesicle protein [Rhizobium sp. SG570]